MSQPIFMSCHKLKRRQRSRTQMKNNDEDHHLGEEAADVHEPSPERGWNRREREG